MKVYLIKASAGSSFSEYKQMTGGPPQNIFSAAAATPSGIRIEMADETIGMKANLRSDADVIAIFMSTPDALRAYEIADEFRSKGKVVVLGGLHTRFMPDEASLHADALLIGEVEGVWEELLSDFQSGNLKQRYGRSEPLDLTELKPYLTDIIPISRYNYTWSVVVSRGCPSHCSFCLVPRFAGRFRLRPVEDIIDEIANCPAEWIELHSDNLTANRNYALELFRALKPLNKKLFAETTILIGRDDELLVAARKAGIKAMLFGIETMSQQALKDQGKGFVKPDEVIELAHNIQSHGIQVVSDFLFGFDAHDSNVFEDTMDYIKKIGFDEIYPHLLIPFPGSKTFEDLDQQGRILTKDWSKYDGAHAVYQPQQMTPEELENGTYWVWQESEKLKKHKHNANNSYGVYGDTEGDWEGVTSSVTGYSGYYWKTALAVTAVAVGLIFKLYWFCGIILVGWALNDIRNGSTFIFEEIRKDSNPGLFWVVVIVWLILGLSCFGGLWGFLWRLIT